MKTFKPLALGVLCRPVEFQRRFFTGFACLTFCPMGETPAILGELAMWKFLAGVLPPEMPLDLALPKTAAEFLVTGSAFAPGGKPALGVIASVRLGAVAKQLMAVGDRHLEDGRATDPIPFTEMPMGWDRAYGGSKVAENPLGRGTEEKPLQGIGYRVPLPNVMAANRASAPATPTPLNFGPIDIAWPQRSKLAGTHDKRWLEEDFPGYARDIDWRMLMAGAPDQRFSGFLRGDEDYAIENMHAEEPLLTGRLPGIAPRLLIQRKGTEALEEVALNLTTVWFFPNAKRLVMIHHGRARTTEEDGRDIERMIMGADLLGAPRPASEFAAVLARRLDPKWGSLEAMRDSALVPAELLIPDPDIEASKAQLASQNLVQKRLRRRQELEMERDRERIRALGIDPDQYAMPPMPPEEPEPEPSLDELPAFVERKEREAEEQRKKGEAFIEAQTASLNMTLAALGLPLQKPIEQKGMGPPKFSAEGKRAELRQVAAQLEAEGHDASLLHDQLNDAEAMKRWDDAEEALRDGYRHGAHEQHPVRRLPTASSEAARAWLTDGRREARRVDFCGVDLSGLDLSGMDLSESWFDGADLSATNLTRAVLDRAVLAHARLDGARLAGARLKEASLGRASLIGADLSGAILHHALLHGANLSNASLRRADLTDAMLNENTLDGIDLSDAVGPRLFVVKASITGLVATGAALDGAMFIECTMPGADFRQAALRTVTFLGSDLTGASFAGADLSRSVFVERCDLAGADFSGARCDALLARGNNLQGARFDGALLNGADFSDADLTGASLDLVQAKEARFMDSLLINARLTRADFREALFSRADLSGADLSDSSLFAADLGRVQADSRTRYERIQRTRTKLVPRRVPA